MLNPAQGTPEWKKLRCGKVTASKVADVVAKTKTGWGASRKNYAAQIIAERLTGVPAEGYTNAAMQWGIDTEPKARNHYAFLTDNEVIEVGYIQHPKIEDSGCSCDGFVGDDGLVEIKCPNTATHIETLLGAEIDDQYIKQMQYQMACTGRKWCDFVSYDPRMPAELQIKIQRVERDNALINDLEKAVITFLKEINEKVKSLTLLKEVA